MSRFTAIYLLVCLPVITVVFSSCHSSEELLHPLDFRYTQSQGNIRFIESVEIQPAAKKIEVVAGSDKRYNHGISDPVLEKYASLMGLSCELVNNMMLYYFIDDWYGVKYRYGGTDKSGIDCSAFVQTAYKEVFCTDLVRTAREQFQSCRVVWDKDNLKEGDLVFFRTRGRRISHVGIYLTDDYFVHASSSSGVMISNLSDAYWSKRYAGAGKIPKEVVGKM